MAISILSLSMALACKKLWPAITLLVRCSYGEKRRLCTRPSKFVTRVESLAFSILDSLNIITMINTYSTVLYWKIPSGEAVPELLYHHRLSSDIVVSSLSSLFVFCHHRMSSIIAIYFLTSPSILTICPLSSSSVLSLSSPSVLRHRCLSSVIMSSLIAVTSRVLIVSILFLISAAILNSIQLHPS